MAATYQNAAEFKDAENRERAKRALLKAHNLENERIAQGWRFVEITPLIQILVPCDAKGKPTKDGYKRIERFKQTNGIK